MARVVIRKARRSDSKGFLGLLLALAKFEHLEAPSEAGMKRLVKDVFERRRIRLLVAADGQDLVGYALYYYGYSSFLARPTLYLEDLFVLERSRESGIGLGLMRQCAAEALASGCGRMEWAVLAWNRKAIDFYEALGARRLEGWHVYRMGLDGMKAVSRKSPGRPQTGSSVI